MSTGLSEKAAIRSLEGKLNNINNITDLNSLIANRSASLVDALSDNQMRTTSDTRNEIKTIVRRLGTGRNSLISEVNNKINNLVAEWNAVGSSKQQSALSARIDALNTIAGGSKAVTGKPPRMTYTSGSGSSHLKSRRAEYRNIKRLQNITDLTSAYSTVFHNIGTANNHTIDESSFYTSIPRTLGARADYSFFDNNGNRLNTSGGEYPCTATLMDGTETEVMVRGISIDNTATPPTINFSNSVTFTPQNIDYSQPLHINVGGVFYDVAGSGINLVNIKAIPLNIDNPDVLNTVKERQDELNKFENAGPKNVVSNYLNTQYTGNIHTLEREILDQAMQDGDAKQYNKLSKEAKEQFYQYVRTLKHPVVTGGDFFAGVTRMHGLNTFASYSDRFTDDDREWNQDFDTISSQKNYANFIQNNVADKALDFIREGLRKELVEDVLNKRMLNGELVAFLERYDRNKLDDNVHNNIDTDLEKPEHRMRQGPRSLIYPRDKNYMRFFAKKTIKLSNQKVDINTNTDPDDVDNIEPVTYDLSLEVSGKNRVSATIDIAGEDKPIKIKAGDPTSLVKRIMKNSQIRYGKLRAHLGFSVYKSMIKMAQESDLGLQYRDDNNHKHELALNDAGSIVARDIDDWTNRTGTNRRNETVLFDQQMFENTNDYDYASYNGSLRHGIQELSRHFNCAMDTVHRQYRRGIQKRFLGLYHSPSRPRLPISAWSSPIKKLLNFRTNTNFDFNTTIQTSDKDVTVQFEKNKFTLSMDGLEEPIASKDLGKLLRKRQGRVRIFDGMEREIVEGVYTALIEKLQTNSKIARTNFGVRDDVSGDMYILDDDGQFGVVSAERIDTQGNPMHFKLRRRGYGIVSKRKLSKTGYEILSDSKKREIMKNPFLMQRLVKAMNARMGLASSVRAMFRS